ncbi:amidohydrolase [Rhizobium sp.]
MKAPDLIVTNGHIVTMDPLTPRAEAIAVRDGKVVALGSTGEIGALATAATKVVDAGGRLVLPGFQDTHIHLQDCGYEYGMNADVTGPRTLDGLKAELAAFAARTNSAWLRGVGWFTGTFNETNLTRHVLDDAVPDRPAYVLSSDCHSGCLNTLACEALGLMDEVPDVEGGHFVIGADGKFTGMVHEEANHWVRARLPEVTDGEYAEGVRFGQALCNRHGITGVLDALVLERHARVYQTLADAGDLTVRICSTAYVHPHEKTGEALTRVEALRRAHSDGGMFRVHSAKFFLDGVMESRTAVMIEDYSDDIGGNSKLLFDAEHVKELFTAFDAARFQIHVHTIGDGAVRAALDGLQAAKEKNGLWPSLHQIAHVECIDPADIPRFGELGAVANIQALWACNDPSVTDVANPMLGPERSQYLYAFRSLIEAGAGFCLSSDWGVSSLNPFEIMSTAITRKFPRKRGTSEPLLPHQCLTREESVKAYTTHAAASAWRSESTGSLTPGKFADIIILDRDIFTCDVEEIAETEVQLTLLGGKEVWRAAAFTG